MPHSSLQLVFCWIWWEVDNPGGCRTCMPLDFGSWMIHLGIPRIAAKCLRAFLFYFPAWRVFVHRILLDDCFHVMSDFLLCCAHCAYINESMPFSALVLQNEDGTKVEYRVWNTFRSKLAAAVLGGVNNIWIVSSLCFSMYSLCQNLRAPGCFVD